MDVGYRLKTVIVEIVKKYIDTLSFSCVFHAKLVSINPLKFIRSDGIEIYESLLVVPKYRKFTDYEIGNCFVFISNHEGQVFYYLYEASSPQGSNGVDYHWQGLIKKGEIRGKLRTETKEVEITDIVGDTQIITKQVMEVDVFKIIEGDLDDVVHEKGIIKKE
ncbi:hypothetical protein HMPREF9629_00610 [Peptoanaerobacter stomatis]|uniref:Uncharacterized protein n=1 Tax=Peptoanaerobacter stomatis TaxID=796937 RepID=G9X2K3_9FIRM|nr:hypothetical protein [Peptoanaerobacter stomatis]EHL11073.1 hypothetical protein HMPREF9629_00610 [Peptoanaerobacter stomatis]